MHQRKHHHYKFNTAHIHIICLAVKYIYKKKSSNISEIIGLFNFEFTIEKQKIFLILPKKRKFFENMYYDKLIRQFNCEQDFEFFVKNNIKASE